MATHQDLENPLMDDNNPFSDLPQEVLSTILANAIFAQKYSKDTAKRKADETIFSNLASVDFHWWSSMKTRYLKNRIEHLTKVYFPKAMMRSTIIRNNWKFLKEVIHPDKIISPLGSCGCLTEEQVRFLTRLRNDKDKNHELLIMLQDFSSDKYSKMIDCLFLANQTPAALVLERGGETVKVHINNGKATETKEETKFVERFQRLQTENLLILNFLMKKDWRMKGGLKNWRRLRQKENTLSLNDLIKVSDEKRLADKTKELATKFTKTFRRFRSLRMQILDDKRFERKQTENALIFDDFFNASVDERLDDVFILHAKQNKGIEMWLWCKTESSLNRLKSLSDDDLREIIQQIYQRLNMERIALKPQLIQMNYSLASDFAERRTYIRHVANNNLTEEIAFGRLRDSKCVTSLADKIYVTHEEKILVYENKYPYHALKPIVFGEVGLPVSIASCNINKCLYIYFSKSSIFKVEPELDNRISQWLSKTDLSLNASVTSKGYVLILQQKTRVNMLLICDSDGTVKRTISMDYSIDGKIKFIQEIMPDVVAVIYEKSSVSEHNCIGIMRLDEDGTILCNIEWHQKIFSLSSFLYGDLLIGTIGSKADADDDISDYHGDDFRTVRLHNWPFDSKAALNLLTTVEKIISIHFAADQKQLFVLSHKKLHIYHFKYEDEDYT